MTPKPNPALVTQDAVRRLPRLALLLFCAAYVLPGLFGRDPWRGAELIAFGQMLSIAEGRAPWLAPALGGVPIDAALLPQGRDHTFIASGYMVLVDLRAKRGAQPLRFDEVLHPDRQPVQGRQRVALHHPALRRAGLRHGALGIKGHHAIDLPIDELDAPQAGVEQFDRRQRLLADERARLAGAEITRFHGTSHQSFVYSHAHAARSA